MKRVYLEIREDVYEHVFFFLKILQEKGLNIIVKEEENKKADLGTQSKFEEILNRYPDVRPFSQIVDPVTWQRELRNEWEYLHY